MPRRKSSDDEQGAPPHTFEDALGSLEAIVESMEQEHLALEELVAHYEKGSALLVHCESILQSARGRIELITLRNQNEISLDDDVKTTEDRELPTPNDPPEDPDDDENDIRLF